ncbi:hypothetical protein PUN28_005800 [Cardiocondyla obscurior]|uniref:Uncharacterized protein n=1 Tax=Cardiocondyla obscurior TaxID=286306 RepID=A0AAW2G5J4_9HYME
MNSLSRRTALVSIFAALADLNYLLLTFRCFISPLACNLAINQCDRVTRNLAITPIPV